MVTRPACRNEETSVAFNLASLKEPVIASAARQSLYLESVIQEIASSLRSSQKRSNISVRLPVHPFLA